MMKRQQHVLMVLMLAGCLLPVCSTIAATVTQPDDKSSATIVIPVTIINQQNTCEVSFRGDAVSGGTYTFRETLLKGQTQQHPAFNAVVTCEENSEVKTALKLRPAGAFQASDNKAGLHPVGDLSVKSGELWLTLADGSTAPMGSNAGDTAMSAFCEGMASDTLENSCRLTPVTSILPSAPGGPVSTTLTFEVVYP
jgi:hypothetical protein